MAKIGRNAPCPCGSGRKQKHCHGALARALPEGLDEAIRRSRREVAAAEQLRQLQQGYGRGIVQAEVKDARILAVGSAIYSSTRWRFFADFLLDFLRGKLGTLDPVHPVVRWFALLVERQRAGGHAAGDTIATPTGGFAASFFYLAYALYLLAHHDQIPEPLLARLRNPKTVLPAIYETYVGAAFALAGFTMQAGETKPTELPQGEFTATSKRSGNTYSVEAKRKEFWANPFKGAMNPEFRSELRQWVRTRLYKSAKKQLPNPVYWFELSIPDLRTEADFLLLREEVCATIAEAEGSLTVHGEIAAPAYVFVTNHVHLVDDSISATPLFAMLEGFRIPTLLSRGYVDLETAMACHDEHRDMTGIIECLAKVSRIPSSFEGVPNELVRSDGSHVRPPKVGDPFSVTAPDGQTVTGTLEEITAVGDTAWVVIREEGTNARLINQVPLTSEEAGAAARYGDAIFGKPGSTGAVPDGDYLTFYDRMLETYRAYPREGLLNQVRGHPAFAEFEGLSREDLHVRVAREVTKAVARGASTHRSEP